MSRTITIDPVTRIEGHARITLQLDGDGHLQDARFHVVEYRGFERFCEGHPFTEMAGITARICGICPVSHLLAAAKTGDKLLAVTIPPAAQKLRRLLNLAQLTQSHALSFFHLSSPDFLLGWECDPARRNVFGLMAADPELARRITVLAAADLVDPAPIVSAPLPAGDSGAAVTIARGAVPGPPPPPPAALTVAVTQLSDFAACPRRHFLLHVVGLGEHPASARAPSPDSVDGDLDPLARGTLAHHLLERADLGGGGADLDALLIAGGYDPATPEVADVRAHVRRFLATPFATRLAAAAASGGVRRELPFLLTEPATHGAPIHLRGQIDLLVVDPAGEEVTVVDYKHARAGSGDDYRFQLDAYALAARRLFPEAKRFVAGLAFLRDPDPQPRLVERSAADAARFASDLARLGGDLAGARAARAFDGRPVETCSELGCGYVSRCHPGRP
jgi:hypothetical protein